MRGGRGLLGAARALAILPLLVLMGVVGFIERAFLYYPVKGLAATPAALGLPYEDVYFRAEDGVRLHGWFVPAPRPGAPSLLWFHGNAGNISHRLENLAHIRARLGLHVFIVDYRGYGQSEGSADEEGTYRDARAALRALRAQRGVDPSRIILFGRSLGAALAVELALHEPFYGLILESPFLNVPAMARVVFPFLPTRWLVSMQYEIAGKVGRARAPVFVLHGDRDEVVPFEQGRRVFELAPEPKRFFTIRGAGHNDTYWVGGEAYWRAWEEFLASLDTAGR
ncbi:MAG: alpha/beta hydrolase [Nitrospinota bacterium]